MNISNIRAELENEQDWRIGEVRYFQNQMMMTTTDRDASVYRKILVMLLYSHYEGYCRFAFDLYKNTINNEGIECGNANFAIVSATLFDVFGILYDSRKKHPDFRKILPDDSKLHRTAREHEFLEKLDAFLVRKVQIPDKIIDTESNLTPSILKKNLFCLGLSYTQIESLLPDLHLLLEFRNSISHGTRRDGIKKEEYEKVRDSTYKVMDSITLDITQALIEERYRRAMD